MAPKSTASKGPASAAGATGGKAPQKTAKKAIKSTDGGEKKKRKRTRKET